MPYSIVVVEKLGTLKQAQSNSLEPEELIKKTGSKSIRGFEELTVWETEWKGKSYHITLYGKNEGKAGMENKYEFPPPVDSELFFGACILVNRGSHLLINEWEGIYDQLYGGFDDLSHDSDDEDDSIAEEGLEKTRTNYVKDGFVVEDDEIEEMEEEEDAMDEESELEVGDSDSEISIAPKKKVAIKKRVVLPTSSKGKKKEKVIVAPEDDNYFDDVAELSEEAYQS